VLYSTSQPQKVGVKIFLERQMNYIFKAKTSKTGKKAQGIVQGQ
jgi:hypothetical protein